MQLRFLIRCALALTALVALLSLMEVNAQQGKRPLRKDGKTMLACGDHTTATIYQQDNKTIREVREIYSDREDCVLYRDDGKTRHTHTLRDKKLKRREIAYFGPGEKKLSDRVYHVELAGEVGTTGVTLTERMDVTVYDGKGEKDYVQRWVYTPDGKGAGTWALVLVMQRFAEPDKERTWLEFKTDAGKPFVTVWKTGPKINGAQGHVYERAKLPAEYSQWVVDRYQDDDPSAP